ncbi:MAG: hypothetical protein WD875_08180 [Pirellulales bacterium]
MQPLIPELHAELTHEVVHSPNAGEQPQRAPHANPIKTGQRTDDIRRMTL